MRQAVQHIAALQHERIAFIAGPGTLKSAKARLEAFQTSMQEIGREIDPELVVEGDHTFDGGMTAMRVLLQLPERPTAVVCSNDMTAVGALHQCYKEHIHIPDEVSIVGYDDTRLSRFVWPPLTTVQMSQTELARVAFTALLREVERVAPEPQGTQYVVKTSLVLRESTALAPSFALRHE
jgi:LacI family transcriptional regulator